MADHIHILLFAVIVICNLWLIFFINQKYRIHKHAFLKRINYLLFFYLLFYILGYVKIYVLKNVDDFPIKNYANFTETLFNTLRIIVIYVLMTILLGLRKLELKKTAWFIFNVIGIILIFSTTLGYFYISGLYNFMFENLLFDLIAKYHIVIKLILLTIACFNILPFPKKRFKLILSFSILLMCAYLLSFLIELFISGIKANKTFYVALDFARWIAFVVLVYLDEVLLFAFCK